MVSESCLNRKKTQIALSDGPQREKCWDGRGVEPNLAATKQRSNATLPGGVGYEETIDTELRKEK